MADDEPWDLERRFWLGDRAFHDGRLARGALAVFPLPVGILDRDAILKSLEAAPRWTGIEMTGRLTVAADGICAIAYHAKGLRAGEASYEALCSSTYILQEGGWKLVAHQQTPCSR